MTKMIIAQQLEEKCPGKPANFAQFHRSVKGAATRIQMFRRVAILAVVSLGLFTTTTQAQVVGITKPFDPASQQEAPAPANQQLAPIGDAVVTGNGIEYHGGPVMLGPHNVYFIWYGNFAGNIALTMLPDLINGFGGSQYFNTNTSYGDVNSNIANTVTLTKQVFDNYSHGTALNNTTFSQVISAPLDSGALPVDSNGIYFLLTSPDVTLTFPPAPDGSPQGFCTAFCGFHTSGTVGTINPIDIKVAFVGDPATQCPRRPNAATCSPQVLSPNGNEGADAMASVMAHELNETVTDPHGDAWFHLNTAGENGDLCNFNFGSTFTALNGANANVVLSGRQFLIQQNWLNANGGGCAMGFNAQAPAGLTFVPVTPCRVADTRNPIGPFGGPFLAANTTRGFTIPSSSDPCTIPATAKAYSVNATVVPHGSLGFLTAFPCGQPLPLASTLNSGDGRVKAAAAIVPAGTNGAVCFFVTNDTELVLDINGYFVPNSDVTALAFYPVAPCRLVDTRLATGSLGGPSLVGNAARTFPVLSGPCNLPATARAYSMNFTAVPKGFLGFLTTWPAGQAQPLVSTLNAVTGTITANSAIVPAGTSGDVSVFVTDNADLVIDVNGYFAPPGTGGLSLYALTPCRVLDTRNSPGRPASSGTIDVSVMLSGCGAPAAAQSFVLNATVVPPGPFGFLALWPQGTPQPLVSTLNAIDGSVTSNLAIVPTTNGQISSFASNPVHLVLDISGYFAP
jgi:Phosphate-induced protein 1 conserved region